MYFYSYCIVYGFFNLFLVFVYEKFRVKIGNLLFVQEDGEQKFENVCLVYENWMVFEQFLYELLNIVGDVYRLVFVVLSKFCGMVVIFKKVYCS